MKITSLDGKTPDIAEENIQKLRQIFPDVFTEDKVDFEKLQQVLGDYVEDSTERYNFTWNGKGRALRLSQTPSLGTLRPCKEESKDWDTTQNLYIEGDNLEVLKLLQKSYYGKIKMIYIDPPYNTGKDFVYKDDFHDSLENYKRITGQVDKDGNRVSTNTETSGRYHTDWLNMMYPRLRLARNLLKDDGVIFISIDDNEVENLKKICNEIFGEDNFIAQLIWTNKEGGGSSDSKLYRIKHEYILTFSKNKGNTIINQQLQEEDDSYSYEDEHVEVRGRYKLIKLNSFSIQYSESLDYPIKIDTGETIYPSENGKKGCWRWSKEKFEWGLKNGFITIKKGNDNQTKIYTKQYFKVDNEDKQIERGLPPSALIDKYSSTMASKQLEILIGNKIFNYSKPINLIKQLLDNATNEDSIILDFFSGSSTTAHAVMQLNAEDGGNRKYIMVQLPEQTDEKSEAYKAGFINICEIGKERIRRAGLKVLSEKWEVISKEEKARYGCKELSRSDCLAKSHGSCQTDLFAGQKITERGNVFTVESDETSSSIDTKQYSGGTSEKLHEGISTVFSDSERLKSGTGNSTATMRESGVPCRYGHFGSDGITTGSGENAECPHKLSKDCPLITNHYPLDIGFKVLKLDTSNIRKWQPDYDNLEQSLLDYVDNYVEGRTELDVVYEIMLKYGLDLTYPVDEFVIADKKVYSIGFGMLMICLDDEITTDVAKGILEKVKELAPESTRVVFKDNGFKTDSNKTNIKEILKSGGIEEFITL